MYRAILAAALVLSPLAAFAQAEEPPAVSEASAVWTADGKVELTVSWDGSACEAPGEAAVTAGPDTTNVVTIPTTETAEVCTMQIVPVTYEGVIAVEPSATTLSILVLDFDGQPKARGSVEIGPGAEATAD